jgi:sodium-coupled neutral amino acid transporter 7/8
VGCLLLCVVVAACEAFTQYVLAKFAERYSAHSYGSLIRKALGRKTSAMLSAILLVYLWGSCVAYLVGVWSD